MGMSRIARKLWVQGAAVTVLLLIVVIIAMTACGGGQAASPVRTAVPDDSTATATMTPTEVLVPTSTPTLFLDSGSTSIPPALTTAGTDREALIALYNATDGQNWIVDQTG